MMNPILFELGIIVDLAGGNYRKVFYPILQS